MSLEPPELPMKVDPGALTVVITDWLKDASDEAVYELGAFKVAIESGHWSTTMANTDWLKAALGRAKYELGRFNVANESGHRSSHGG